MPVFLWVVPERNIFLASQTGFPGRLGLINHVHYNITLVCFSNNFRIMFKTFLMGFPNMCNFTFAVLNRGINTFLSTFFAFLMPHSNEKIMRIIVRVVLLEVVADNTPVSRPDGCSGVLWRTIVLVLPWCRRNFHFIEFSLIIHPKNINWFGPPKESSSKCLEDTGSSFSIALVHNWFIIKIQISSWPKTNRSIQSPI